MVTRPQTTRSGIGLRRAALLLVAGLLSVSGLSAKKAPTVLEWKTGFVWESPDACIDTWGLNKETFLIIGDDDTLYHVSRSTLVSRKANVTERATVKYAIANGEFYLQDEGGRVFKLSIVKTEVDLNAAERLRNGKQPCQP